MEGYEKIEYASSFVDNVFDPYNSELVQCFDPRKRCLAIMDLKIFTLYGRQMLEHFDHFGMVLKIHKTMQMPQ